MSDKLNKLVLPLILLVFAAVLVLMDRRTRFAEDLYLQQISVDANMLRAYDRVLKDGNLSQEEKVNRINHVNSIHAKSIGGQMDAVFQAHGRQVPEVRKELKAIETSERKGDSKEQ